MSNNKKPKLIIFFSKLSVGGMEKALINLIKMSNLKNNYDITLYLGYFLEKSYLYELKKYAKVCVVWPYKWNICGKIYTYFKMNVDKIKIKNKYDISICYSHHHKILSDLTKIASSNPICFIHGDLYRSRSKEQLIKLNKDFNFNEYKKIICVSNMAKESFIKAYPNYNGLVYVINNYIDGEDIIKKSNEKVDFEYKIRPIFINITRHIDKDKQVSFIIEASKKLIDKGYKFNVLLVGNGPDTEKYKELISKYKLENTVYLLGKQLNPYKYLSKCDALVFTSKYEGYGLVLDEARVLNVPLITTSVGDSQIMIQDGYGILCDSNIEGVYLGMKKYLDNGFKTKNFSYKEFNEVITKKIDEVIINE